MKRHDERDWRDQYTLEMNREQQRIASRRAADEMAKRERQERNTRRLAIALLWLGTAVLGLLVIKIMVGP
jgi:hypothetical protein